MQRVADALSQAELTQCAHRNRALRYDGRAVVTMCIGAVDFLPATTTITSLPQLTEEGAQRATKQQQQADQRMRAALAAIEETGEMPTGATIAALAKVRKADACTWLRSHRQEAEDAALCASASGSHNGIENIYQNGNRPAIDVMMSPASADTQVFDDPPAYPGHLAIVADCLAPVQTRGAPPPRPRLTFSALLPGTGVGEHGRQIGPPHRRHFRACAQRWW